MRLTAFPAWRVDGTQRRTARVVDARLLPLLRAVRRHGSLTAAAREAGVPYRTAWAVLEAAEKAVGAPLAVLARGRGATLTEFGARWLAADESAASLLAAQAARLDVAPARPSPAARRTSLRVAASHDIALAQLKDRWRAQHGIALAFHGSAESLDLYAAGNADVAGFHYGVTPDDDRDPLLARLRPKRDALVRFLTRTQGLIVPRGNPRRVRTLSDVADARLSIVNRQPGSGTRLLLDRLLAAEGIDGSRLAGYGSEEFTHAAVAATVAAGRADVGFGIEAAAAQFGLTFVPLVRERYRFVCRRRTLDSEPVAAFRTLLASDATRAVVRPLPGYRLDAPGRVMEVA